MSVTKGRSPVEPYLSGLIGAILPCPGVLMSVRAYFDESYSPGTGGVFCVAGYVLDKNAVDPMERAWKANLDRYGLSRFHMVECAHGTREFKHLSPAERIAVETAAIGVIQEHARYGHMVVVKKADFNETVRGLHTPDVYSFCCYMALAGVRNWADRVDFQDHIAFLFEAGHENQGHANQILGEVLSSPKLAAAYRYASHTFVKKELAGALQAADLLAWQTVKLLKCRDEGRQPRKDFLALIQDGSAYNITHIKRDRLGRMAEDIHATFSEIEDQSSESD